jgi:hypothetical protein
MAGAISDHLLISVVADYHHELPEFDQLKPDDQQLIEALRTGGVFHIATWAPTDTIHIRQNFDIMRAHNRKGQPLDYSGPESIYNLTPNGDLELNSEHSDGLVAIPAVLEKIVNFRGTRSFVDALTVKIRFFLERTDLKKITDKQDAPYGQRILGSRVMKKVSIYGVLKEINAAMHDPHEYQDRHLKALEVIVKYDIPYLVIIHRDDFMVSANRHIQEHDYLLAARMKKEGVQREQDLKVPARLVLLERDQDQELEVDPINPHFLILSTTHDGVDNAREVTAAITRFVNENVARATQAGKLKPLASVTKWSRENTLRSRRAAPRKTASRKIESRKTESRKAAPRKTASRRKARAAAGA